MLTKCSANFAKTVSLKNVASMLWMTSLHMQEMSRQGVSVSQSVHDKKEHSFDESAIARLRGIQCFSVRFLSKALNLTIVFFLAFY